METLSKTHDTMVLNPLILDMSCTNAASILYHISCFSFEQNENASLYTFCQCCNDMLVTLEVLWNTQASDYFWNTNKDIFGALNRYTNSDIVYTPKCKYCDNPTPFWKLEDITSISVTIYLKTDIMTHFKSSSLTRACYNAAQLSFLICAKE